MLIAKLYSVGDVLFALFPWGAEASQGNKVNVQSPNLTGNPTVNGSKIATIKAPTWLKLAPSSGFIATHGPYYCKDGCGIVWLIGVLRRESVPQAGEVMLILPEGYRPALLQPLIITAHAGVDGPWATYAYISTDGKLKFQTGSTPSNWYSGAYFAFQVSFPAS